MTVKNSSRTRRKYDSSFKDDVLKMVASGRRIGEISKALDVSASLIHRWNKLPRDHSDTKSTQSSSNSSAEIERLKAELRRTEQERDILKKALGIFSRGI
jgi:transposase